jgi:hypothetical protein
MTALGADDYPKGHGALEVFDDAGFVATPLWVRIWLGFLISTFAVGLVFAWKHSIARWAIGGFVVSAASGAFVFAALGCRFWAGRSRSCISCAGPRP